MLATIVTQVYDLREAIIIASYFIKTVSLLFIPFCYWDCSFARDSMLSSFCHICTSVKQRHDVSTCLMLMHIIFSTYSIGILLLVLIFYCIDFRYSTIKTPCSVMFVYGVRIESQFIAMVAQLAPVAN